MDGTLIDSQRDLANSVKASRDHLGLAPVEGKLIYSCVGTLTWATEILEAIPKDVGQTPTANRVLSAGADPVWPPLTPVSIRGVVL